MGGTDRLGVSFFSVAGTNDKAPSVAGRGLGVRPGAARRQRARATLGPPERVVAVVVLVAAREFMALGYLNGFRPVNVGSATHPRKRAPLG